MNRLRYILQHRYYVKIFCLIILIFILLYLKFNNKKSNYSLNSTEFIGVIYKLKNSKLYLKDDNKERIVVNYEEDFDYIIGDKVKVIGVFNEPSNNTIFNLFNYKKYLYNENIFYIVEADEIIKISNNINIFNYLKDKISKRIDNLFDDGSYIKLFILGDNSLIDEDILKTYQVNGISHLFSISGMHISLFCTVILYIMKRLTYNNYFRYGIVISFLLVYISVINFSISALRSIIMYIIFSLNKLLNLNMKKIDILLCILIIILLINPYYIYNVGFQFSYMISFTLIIFNYKLKNIKSSIKRSLYISFVSFLVSMPICIYNYYNVNLLSVIYNLVLVPFVSLVIFPLSIITFIFPFLLEIFKFLINILESISLYLSNIDYFITYFVKPNLIIIIIYYFFIFLFLYNYKYFYLFILILLHKFYPFLNNNLCIDMLDVGQGDSILIRYPYNMGNILIDTGGTYSDSDYMINNIINFLHSVGINKLDYLIITHGGV